MDSLLVKNIGFLSLEQIKKLAYERNQELCLPPLDDRDMERLWNQALDWANRKIREREEAAAKQQQQNQHEQEEGQKIIIPLGLPQKQKSKSKILLKKPHDWSCPYIDF
jgi:hypothetical protein